jgi:hypothetical protein
MKEEDIKKFLSDCKKLILETAKTFKIDEKYKIIEKPLGKFIN